MGEYNVRFRMSDGLELMNDHGIGRFGLKKKDEKTYVIDIGNGFRSFEIRLEKEMAKGVLHWNAGAASIREMLENEEMAQQPAEHIFLYVNDRKIDLYEDVFPTELRIGEANVTYDSTEPGDLNFNLYIVWGEATKSNWQKVLAFEFPHAEKAFSFDYLGTTYYCDATD